jgi:hypothetical protein
MKWVEHVASTGEIRNTDRILVGHMEETDNLEAQVVDGSSNEMYLIETEW